jgi:O-antigen ligase
MIPVAVLLLLIGVLSGYIGPYAWVAVIGSVVMVGLIIFRLDELAAVLMLAIHLIADWYLGFRIVSLILTLLLLCAYFVGQSPLYPWAKPRYLWLWLTFLGLTIIPAVRGATDLFNTLFYYPNLVFGAILMFWMGTIIARSLSNIRHFFMLFSVFCALVAVQTLIQAKTGTFLFDTSHNQAYVAQLANNHLPGMPDVSRLGSFFYDPNWAGAFFAMTLFIPLGLLLESTSLLGKIFYLTEAVLICLALLFTYSGGSLLAVGAAAVTFFALIGGIRHRVLFLICLAVAAIAIFIGFSSNFMLLLQHFSNPTELSSRLGVWRTALRVISAFPLTGVGLGETAYEINSIPFMDPAQLVPLAHPHDSYLEWAAMAGLPTLIVFAGLLMFNLKAALLNWVLLDFRARSLIAAGFATVVSLSFNSLSINGWTFPALAAIGWVILGTISSPLISSRPSEQGISKVSAT